MKQFMQDRLTYHTSKNKKGRYAHISLVYICYLLSEKFTGNCYKSVEENQPRWHDAYN